MNVCICRPAIFKKKLEKWAKQEGLSGENVAQGRGAIFPGAGV
jgi:hypothetical protein